jgi:hypothetical protein
MLDQSNPERLSHQTNSFGLTQSHMNDCFKLLMWPDTRHLDIEAQRPHNSP